MTLTTAKRVVSAGVAIAALAAAALCTGAGASSSRAGAGGTATLALPPGTTSNFIFPIVDGAHYTVANIEQFQRLMWRPLYMYGKNGRPVLNEQASLAMTPIFEKGNARVTITLKPYMWSDGLPVTSRDFTFLFNLIKANKKKWAGYLPGDIPDSVRQVKVVNEHTFTLVLDRAYSPIWFTGNQLSQLMPIPQHAWDKESADGAIGNWDETVSGAKAVYDYLIGEAQKPSEYASNPLWQVVDGPWKLSAYRTDGYAAFVPNLRYSGPNKPKLDSFVEQPFTTAQAELNVLRSGGIDYGYLPQAEAAQAHTLESQGYRFRPWVRWGINYVPFNFANPVVGPIFKQLYVRQAIQMLIDQDGYVKNLLKGYGWPTSGPVPLQPANPYVSPYVRSMPYRYSPAKAVALLKSHGWTIHPNGVSVCNGNCGAGIRPGATLAFELLYAVGDPIVSQEVQAWKSAATQAGIKLSLSGAPFNEVIAGAAPCQKGHPCTWQLAYWGGGWLYGVNPIPVGDQQFLCRAGANFGQYCDGTNDANIRAVQRQAGPGPLLRYQNYMAQQLGVLWMPYRPYQLSMIKNTLKGVVQSPILSLTPEEWSFTQ